MYKLRWHVCDIWHTRIFSNSKGPLEHGKFICFLRLYGNKLIYVKFLYNFCVSKGPKMIRNLTESWCILAR
jgi:hypothetical protein